MIPFNSDYDFVMLLFSFINAIMILVLFANKSDSEDETEEDEIVSLKTVYDDISEYCEIQDIDGKLKGISFTTSNGEEKNFMFEKSDDINFKDNSKEVNKVTVIVKDQQNMNKTKRTYIIEGE